MFSDIYVIWSQQSSRVGGIEDQATPSCIGRCERQQARLSESDDVGQGGDQVPVHPSCEISRSLSSIVSKDRQPRLDEFQHHKTAAIDYLRDNGVLPE
jgi:hypothetical protein